MLKIKVITIGKIKHSWLQLAIEEYTKRLTKSASIEWVLLKNLDVLQEVALSEKSPICLDPEGKELTSPQLATFIKKEMIDQGSRLTFIIGGDEGLSPAIKAHSKHILSLSRLTFTHQMTRLILLEQLYRASEIQKGSPYHK